MSVWIDLFKYEAPHGISILRQEADKTGVPAIKERLLWAMSKAQDMCNPEEAVHCKEAMKSEGIK
jgi:hypothetical protein